MSSPLYKTLLFLAALSSLALPSQSSAAPRGLWIDTDLSAGVPARDVDDALALALALASPELDLIGISTVFGNTDLEQVQARTKELLAIAESPLIPAPGAAAAKLGEAESEACRAMAAALEKAPLTILALGPLTNIAELLRRHPKAAARITELIVVAGRRPGELLKPGRRELRDLNFELDPEAARQVLGSELRITLTGYFASLGLECGAAIKERLKTGVSPLARALAPAVESWRRLWRITQGREAFQPFDLAAVAWLLRGDQFKLEEGRAMIEAGALNFRREAAGRVGFVSEPAPELLDWALERICQGARRRRF